MPGRSGADWLKALTLLVVLALLPVMTKTALADQFVGEEGGDAEPEKEKEKPAPKHKSRAKSDDDEHESSHGGAISFSGGLGAGDGYLNAQITVGYGFNRWIGIDTTAYYYQVNGNSSSGEEYGPEVDLVLRGANPTIVTPFVGAGPGYLRWKRLHNGTTFSDGGSVTANGFVGVDVALTKHFGIEVQRKQVTYVGTPPKSFDDQTTDDPKSSVSTIIGFRASL